MPAERAIVHRFPVGSFSVELSVPAPAPGSVRHAICEWSPAMPGRPLTAREDAQYRAGLARAMELAQEAHSGGDTWP